MPEPTVQRSSARLYVRQGRTVEVVLRSSHAARAQYVNLTVTEARQLQRKLGEHLDALRRENLEAPLE